MNTLHTDLLYIIGRNLNLNGIIYYTITCKRIYKLRDKLVIEYETKRGYEKFRDNFMPIFNMPIYNNLYGLILRGIEHKIWFLKFSDIDEDMKYKILTMLGYYSNVKITDYVMETIINVYQRICNERLTHFCKFIANYSTFKYISTCKHKPGFIFDLCYRVLKNCWPGICTIYWDNYYSYKLNKYKDKYNKIINQKHYELLCRCRQYFPEFYYDKLKTLTLTKKHWTRLFIYDYNNPLCRCCHKIHKYWTKCKIGYFNNKQDIIIYYKDKPLLKDYIKRKFNIDI